MTRKSTTSSRMVGEHYINARKHNEPEDGVTAVQVVSAAEAELANSTEIAEQNEAIPDANHATERLSSDESSAIQTQIS